MNWLGVLAVALVVVVLYLMYFTGNPAINYHSGDIVDCNRFYEVTDMYKTPGPVYHAALSNGITLEVTAQEYSAWKEGDYLAWLPGYETIHIIHLNETETGYRNACQVI